MTDSARVFYRKSPEGVIVEKEGRTVAVYRSTEELIEVHIKGLLARDQQDAQKVRDIYRNVKPDED